MDPDARNWDMTTQDFSMPVRPAWTVGRPTAPGIWVLRMKNRDLVTATVRWDEYDDETDVERARYLRIDDGETSEELDRAEGEIGRWVACSFGPIPHPSPYLGSSKGSS